jgi:S1-C subfamily serine protease
MVRSAIASVAIIAALVGQPASGNNVLLLDFTSPHCGPCQQMAPTIENLERAGYPIRKIDVTRDTPSAAQYKVARVPMLVMLVDGQEFERVQGGMSGSQLEAMFHRARAESQRRNQSGVRAQSPERRPAIQTTAQVSSPAPSVAWPSAAQQQAPWPVANASASTLPPTGRPQLTDSSYGRRPSANGPSPAESAPNAVAASDPRLMALVGASVRLRVEDTSGFAFGTGTIIDTRQGEALVITCAHLFRESKGTGPLSVEMFEATPGGPRSAGKVPGLVISYDLDRDVALVAIRPGRPVSVARVASPQTAVARGDRVVSIGCSNGQDPTVLASRVTSLDRYQGPPNIEASGAPVEGRSGGGLFNEQGQLIGVCFAADHEANEGLYAALKAIHDELGAQGLNDVYLATGNPSSALASSSGPAGGPVVRGQDAGVTAMPAPNRERAAEVAAGNMAIPAPIASPITPAFANPVEQAAWDEIIERAASSEVICIIRPKQPGAQSEVLTLDGMSPEFVRALAALRKERSNLTR